MGEWFFMTSGVMAKHWSGASLVLPDAMLVSAEVLDMLQAIKAQAAQT